MSYARSVVAQGQALDGCVFTVAPQEAGALDGPLALDSRKLVAGRLSGMDFDVARYP